MTTFRGAATGVGDSFGLRRKVGVDKAYAATVAIATADVNNNEETVVVIGELAGNASVTAAVDGNEQYPGDKLLVMGGADGSDRTITWSTGFAGQGGTLVVTADKFFCCLFVFNGAKWVQAGGNADTV